MTEAPDERMPGIHHVTSVATSPEKNVSFYTEVLGLRWVKKTVNFDDTSTYHLYYGDEVGHPGTALTFFTFDLGRSGRVGRGQATATAFTVPEGALGYWRDRFDNLNVETGEVRERFGREVLPFRDHDGHPMELVVGTSDIEPWEEGPVPPEYAVRGFDAVTLDSLAPSVTCELLQVMGFEEVGEEGNRRRLRGSGDRARFVDVLDRSGEERGRPGAGTVHHVAFRTADSETQKAWRSTLSDLGLQVTPQKDRHYFESIYFREPGGVLFEIATDEPGFTRDQSVEKLGESLSLPPWLESDREAIEAQLDGLDEERLS